MKTTPCVPISERPEDPDAEAHVYVFLQKWEVNHVSQRLTEPEGERSKIAEFSMTLEGPAARWHAKHLPGNFATFEALKAKFLSLFHRQVKQRELVDEAKEMFQAALREPLRTMSGVLDF